MMRFVFIEMVLLMFLSGHFVGCENKSAHSSGEESPVDSMFVNPVWDGADPWMVKKDSFYYYCYSESNSIKISRSLFMTQRGETQIVWTAPASGWNRDHIWAPELQFIDGHWYIYYAAGETGPPYIDQRSGVLRSEGEDVFGNYEETGILQTGEDPDDPTGAIWAIDVNVFTHQDQMYAVWSGWEENAEDDNTPQHLYIAPMSDPHTLDGPRVKISSPTEEWETGGPLDLNEGPEALKHSDDLFIIYSCRESWLKEYRLGQLRLKNFDSDPMDPASWVKSGPVFLGTQDVYGTGHACFVQSPDGTEDWILYHSKKSTEPGWNRDVRMQPFQWKADGSPDFGKPVPAGVPLDRPSGEVAIEKSLSQ